MTVDGTPPPHLASTDFAPDSVHLRPMEPDDSAAVRSLVLAGLADHWGSVDASLNTDLDDLAAAHPGSRTVVAVDPLGTIVGTGTVVPRGSGTAEVVRMSVATSARGAGIGRRVLDALTELSREWGVDRLVLETTATWTATVAFYERCGFRVTHVVDGEFGRDAWFERRLDPGQPEPDR